MLKAIEFILADLANGQEAGSPEEHVLNYASGEIIGLRNRLAAALRKNRWYDALIAAGVNDWEGYEDAMAEFKGEDDGQDD